MLSYVVCGTYIPGSLRCRLDNGVLADIHPALALGCPAERASRSLKLSHVLFCHLLCIDVDMYRVVFLQTRDALRRTLGKFAPLDRNGVFPAPIALPQKPKAHDVEVRPVLAHLPRIRGLAR